ncbi:MAG TPA: DNA polymerase III subunit alpha, partial [Spirochaetia bacterium]|nr:DNA polymerase III subunit alpha [Spirochaetia bacterium]
TLTIIDKTARMIRKKGIDFYIDRIPENDPATFELLGQGKSTCVFQFESTGMQDVLKRAKPGNINELSDLNALYRPGPMENIDQYVDSKAGRKAVTYPIIELEPILQQTYGVITYQEQVMQIAREIAGYSLGQADILRKAMGKKKKDVMDEQKKKFIEGALQKGFPKAVATKIFDLFVPFAGYGFNKCHSAPYSLLAYQTAFLKANYPAEFMAANLTSEINNTDKMAQYMSEAKSMGIQILAPDVNLSEKEFTVVDGKIVYGLCGVKNVGSSAVDSILQERGTSGPFTNIHNFLERIDLKTVNRKVFEAMILTGVLDKFGENRATLFHSLDRLMEIATRTKENRAYGQESLFDKEQIDSMVKVELERVDEWPQAELLRLERQNLGFFFSGHPMEEFQDIIRRHANLDLSKTDAASPQRVYVLIGILRDLKEIVTRKGNKMAFGSLEDYNGCIELVFFPEVYEKTRAHLVSDNVIAVKGKLDKNRGDPKMLVDEVSKPGELASKKISTIHIRLSKNFQEEETLYELRDFIFRQSGDCTLYLHLKSNGHGEERVVRASPAITVSSDEQALQRLRGYPNVAEVWVE